MAKGKGLFGSLLGGKNRGFGLNPGAGAAADLAMPREYQRLRSDAGDPPGSVCYAAQSESAAAFVMVQDIPAAEAMPFDSTAPVIAGIHGSLGPDQGLIEVECGMCASGVRWMQSIVKSAIQPHGVQYCLTLHLEREGGAVQVQGFFDEMGTTGMRDTIVFSQMRSTGRIASDMQGWMRDPYDPDRTKGLRMNLSELREYDAAFPGHPLSMARALVGFLTR